MARRTGRAARSILGLTAGRTKWQFVWRRLHALSLAGRHFGHYDVDASGELVALRYAGEKRPDANVVVDVGANLGRWSVQARGVWPSTDIHAFEPATAMYEQLVGATPAHGARCVHAACGAASGTATLYSVPGLPGLSSLHERDLTTHALRMTPAEVVAVTTLDEYCEEQGIDRIDYLKIDTEGHELAVLQGARRMIENRGIAFIQFEFGGANIDSRTYVRDFVRLLTPRYRIWRVLIDGLEPLVYGEREEVFVTTNFLAEHVR